MLRGVISDLWGNDFLKACESEAIEKTGSSTVGLQDILVVAIAKLIKKPKVKKPKKETETAATWDAFSAEYQRRYGASTVRNATVNAQMANFVKRIGMKEGPEVAVFYIRHNDLVYVRNAHSVGMLVRDAEKLRTEWATGKKVSTRRQTNAEANAEVAGELWKRNQDGGL